MLFGTSRLSLAIKQVREDPKSVFRAVSKKALRGLKISAHFLKTCYVDGFLALVAGRYTRRQAAMIIAGNVATILGALLVTFPSILFPSPEYHAFYHFGSMLSDDPTSLIPITLGAVSSTLGLRIPLS